MNIFKKFADSAKEFGNLRSVVTAAFLIALHTVLACFVSIQVTTSLRISVSFLANICIGYMFGPVMGFVCAGAGDILQFILKPTGPYFPGWTLSAALAGLIYGCFFYKSSINIKAMSYENDEKKDNKWNLVLNILSLITAVLAGISWIALPFAQISGSKGEIIVNGKAFSIIQAAITSDNKKVINLCIIAVVLAVVIVFAIISSIMRINAIPLVVSVLAVFVSILSVYTDKKTTSVSSGFTAVCVFMIIFIVLKIIVLMMKHSIDTAFMVKCVIVLVVDTFLVNVFLGTYWVSVMYGKGFAFYFTTRLAKNVIQLPVNIILTYYMLGVVKKIKGRIE